LRNINLAAIHPTVKTVGFLAECMVTETRRRVEERAEVQNISGRIVRSVGRRLYQVVVDAEVQRMGDYP